MRCETIQVRLADGREATINKHDLGKYEGCEYLDPALAGERKIKKDVEVVKKRVAKKRGLD